MANARQERDALLHAIWRLRQHNGDYAGLEAELRSYTLNDLQAQLCRRDAERCLAMLYAIDASQRRDGNTYEAVLAQLEAIVFMPADAIMDEDALAAANLRLGYIKEYNKVMGYYKGAPGTLGDTDTPYDHFAAWLTAQGD